MNMKSVMKPGVLKPAEQQTKQRILFVIPYVGMVERIGIMQLSSIAKQLGHAVELATMSRGDVEGKMKAFAPDFVCYAIHSGEHTKILGINRDLKARYEFTSIFGGPHAMFHPQIIEEEGVDIVCAGEAEEVFIQLLSGTPVKNIKGIHCKDGAKTMFTGYGTLERDLDKYPFPDRELFYSYEKELGNHGEKRISISRGCPFICTYCWNNEVNKRYDDWGRLRVRSVDKVVEEVNSIRQKYPIRHIRFTDDTFNAIPLVWLREFAGKFGTLNIPFSCNVRASLTTPEIARLLRQAGCLTVFLAIETSNEQLRKDLLKRYETNEQIKNAISWYKNEGIKVATYSLCGLPVENPLAVDLETLKFNSQLHVDMSWASLFSPTPSTDLANYAIEHGYFSGNFDELYSSTKIGTVLKLKNKREVTNLQKFFGICSSHPWLIPVVKQLVKLPPNRFFRYLQFAYYGWREKFILSETKPGLKEIISLMGMIRYHA